MHGYFISKLTVASRPILHDISNLTPPAAIRQPDIKSGHLIVRRVRKLESGNLIFPPGSLLTRRIWMCQPLWDTFHCRVDGQGRRSNILEYIGANTVQLPIDSLYCENHATHICPDPLSFYQGESMWKGLTHLKIPMKTKWMSTCQKTEKERAMTLLAGLTRNWIHELCSW